MRSLSAPLYSGQKGHGRLEGYHMRDWVRFSMGEVFEETEKARAAVLAKLSLPKTLGEFFWRKAAGAICMLRDETDMCE